MRDRLQVLIRFNKVSNLGMGDVTDEKEKCRCVVSLLPVITLGRAMGSIYGGGPLSAATSNI